MEAAPVSLETFDTKCQINVGIPLFGDTPHIMEFLLQLTISEAFQLPVRLLIQHRRDRGQGLDRGLLSWVRRNGVHP
jgi:hypothetical protein